MAEAGPAAVPDDITVAARPRRREGGRLAAETADQAINESRRPPRGDGTDGTSVTTGNQVCGCGEKGCGTNIGKLGQLMRGLMWTHTMCLVLTTAFPALYSTVDACTALFSKPALSSGFRLPGQGQASKLVSKLHGVDVESSTTIMDLTIPWTPSNLARWVDLGYLSPADQKAIEWGLDGVRILTRGLTGPGKNRSPLWQTDVHSLINRQFHRVHAHPAAFKFSGAGARLQKVASVWAKPAGVVLRTTRAIEDGAVERQLNPEWAKHYPPTGIEMAALVSAANSSRPIVPAVPDDLIETA
jgi:hypothetical protein